MRPRYFNFLLAILLSTALMTSFVTVTAKPVDEHPDWANWPANTLWGAKLSLENSYADVYYGATTGGEHVYALPPAPTPPWIKLALEQSIDYGEITRTQDSAPQSYTYYVTFQATTAQTGLTLSTNLENADTLFVPQDFSVIIENAGAAIGPWNMRAGNGSISLSAWIVKYATLYVDNAVNIESIDNLDPLSGTMGDTLRLNVTVKNTGIKTDTYNVSAGGGIDPPVGPLAPDTSDTVMVTTTLPGGTADIVITAAGAYATDQDSVSATGTTPIVVKGFDTAWTVNDSGSSGIEPWIYFSVGETPAAMVAKDDVGSGGVAASGFMNAFTYSGGYPWYGDNLDIFLDNTFQYINPGAVNILWWDWNTYYTSSGASSMIAKLEAMGYNVDGDDRPLENLYAGYTIPPGSFIENLLATDDSYAMSDDPTANGQDGDASDVHVGRFTYEENDWGYMKWDLTGLGATATSITSATLVLDTYWDPDNDMTVGFYESDDAWNEDNMSWDNRPTSPITGDTNFNDAYTFATEWDNYAKDTTDFLGEHSGGLGLFISEYIEGGSYNKAIEIYTSSPVDNLSNYQLELYSNGSATITSSQVLSGTLDSGDVYVLSHGSANAAIQAVTDLTSGTCNWNGDDGIVLRRIGDNAVIDSIGQYNVDPGTEWDPIGSGGKDQTQVRKSSLATLDMTQQPDGAWWTVDVTDYVQAQFASDNVVSLMLKSENESLPASEGHSVQFASHERSGGIYGPFLEITYLGEAVVYDNDINQYDIFVIGQLQFNDPEGPGSGKWGGDPDAMSDESVEIIREFVQDNGKGLFIGEAAAYTYQRYNYNRVHNRILHELDFGWWFQHDAIVDNANSNQTLLKMGGYMDILADPEDAHPIGAAFIAATGHDNIRLYKSASLIQEPTFTATVSVQDNTGLAGAVVNVEIPLTNTSDVWDNFDLTATDTKGWASTDNLSTTKIYLDNGASTTVSILVAIPPGTPPGTVDNITVTATSFSGYGSKLTFSGTGKVTVLSYLATVEVEILPGNTIAHASVVDRLINPSYSYDPLTFAVKVTNKGLLNDKYELTVIGDPESEMSLKLDPSELYVPADDAEYASLSVTIPEDWWAFDTGTVTVIAEGMVASVEQVVIGPTDNDSVVVEAGENKSVEIEILPDSLEPQTGAPDSPLVWLVVIKNTGNAPDTFYWSGPNEELSGVSSNSASRSSWGATLDNTDPVYLEPSTKAINYLYVTVPGDAKTSEWDNITVDIATYDNVVRDEQTVRAHVLEPGPRIPEGVIEIAVEAEVIAIYVHPTQYDFEVMDEHKVKSTTDNFFKVRNTGNVNENILVRGTDAQSMPGEPVTTWELDDSTTSVDQYRMAIVQIGDTWLNDEYSIVMWSDLAPGLEELFDLKIETPTAITTPARMWARVKFIAIASGTTDVGSPP